MKKKIWTLGYQPFIMGGDVNGPISTEVEIIEEKEINGFNFFSFMTPKGTLKIAEKTTGGIIEDSFEDVEKSMKDESKEFLQSLLDEQMLVAEKAVALSSEEFFKLYKY